MIRATDGPPAGLVLDSSVTMAWCFSDEGDPYADSAMDALQDSSALVPHLWPIEVANAMLMGERRGRSSRLDSARWLGFLDGLPIAIDGVSMFGAAGAILDIARTSRLSAYDAAYLELAMRRGLPLATLDAKLRAAAKAAGAAIFGDPA